MIERTYIIPLRKAFMRAKPYKKTKRAVSEVRKFLQRHMKSDDVRLGKYLNLKLWEHGAKNPPAKIEVAVKKEDDNIVHAELVGAPEEQTPTEKKAAKKAARTNKKAEKETKQATDKTTQETTSQKETDKTTQSETKSVEASASTVAETNAKEQPTEEKVETQSQKETDKTTEETQSQKETDKTTQ